MKYLITYVANIEFGAMIHDFQASNNEEARREATIIMKGIRKQKGRPVKMIRLEQVESQTEMTEHLIPVPFTKRKSKKS